jgi:poly-gamma-glutamate synthesis protein (capsule biosynthesis protein)
MALLGFVGDIVVDRDDPESVFDAVTDVLAVPDALFGNCEAAYTDDPQIAPTNLFPVVPAAKNLRALRRFDVLSLATNHILDGGYAALLETYEGLRASGSSPVGVGRDILEARRPAAIERGGLRLAFLSRGSIFPFGYEADVDRPGLAPLRAMNHHVERFPGYWAPGLVGSVVSVPHREDYESLASDLERARAEHDLVVASFHWGDFQTPFALTDHERSTARFAIEHGADVVVGHHHHTLRGVEWYAGKPIFYGLGHFVLDLHAKWSESQLKATATLGEADSYDMYDRPGWPLLPMHPDSRMTMVGWVETDDKGAPAAAGFVPCALTPDGRVHPHDAGSDTGRSVARYVERCCDAERLAVRLRVSGGRSFAGVTPFEFELDGGS